MRKKVLIVSRDVTLKQDGGTLVTKRNERLLRELGFEIEHFVVPIPSMLTRLKNILLKESYGETASLKKSFKQILSNDYEFVFFDGSIYGGFLRMAAEVGHRCWCFYHNVECEYYRQKASATGSIPDKIMVGFIKFNEALSTKYSTTRIVLNERDSDGLKSTYGKNADIILPTSFPQKDLNQIYEKQSSKLATPYLLFVGSNFFANEEGLKYYFDHIVPNISIKTIIVGNIDEAFRNFSYDNNKVEFKGRVDDLEPYYVGASAVIAPILSGSGLKTKTAEALSFGKTVIGFPEAFEGIPIKGYEKAVRYVKDPEAFIKEVNALNFNNQKNIDAIRLFENELSDSRQIEKIKSYIDSNF